MVTKLTAVACIVAASLLTGDASASAVHFAGVPPAGVKASTPTTGTMVLSLRPTPTTTWNVYADGRVIWQRWTPSGDASVVPDGAKRLDTTWVQQRLTLQGVQLLQSKIVSTGLFDRDLKLALGGNHASVFHRVLVGGRIVSVEGVSGPDSSWPDLADFTKATPAQARALAWIEKLVAHPARWLPRLAWADRDIRSFVPARYEAAFDRSDPDLSKLPPLARKAFSRYYLGHGCLLTTAHTRALLQAFAEAGLSPAQNHAGEIAFELAGSARTPTGRPIPADFHLSPALPDDAC